MGIKASTNGIKKAQEALIAKKLKKKDIEARMDCSHQPVSKFFNSQQISPEYFVRICDILGLKWEEIRDNEQSTQDIDALVSEVRQKAQTSIVQECGAMRVLDMREPIGLNDIYTDVYILEKITGRQRIEIDQLSLNYNPDSDDFDRHWLNKREKRISGIEIVNKSSKVVILGKPGSGKTTFLKFLCLQCNSGNFQSKRLPIFISLKEFAEVEGKPNLLTFIQQKFEKLSVTQDEIMKVLIYGRGLIVLDGLDEVSEEDNKRVIKEIENFSDTYSLASNIQKYLEEHSKKREKVKQALDEINNKKDSIKRREQEYVPKHYRILKEHLYFEENIYKNLEKIKQLEKKEVKEIKQSLDFLEDIKKEIPKTYQVLDSQEEIKPLFEKNEKNKDSLQKIQENPKLLLKVFQEEKLILKSLAIWSNHLEEQSKQKKEELEGKYPDLNQSQNSRQKFLSKLFPDTVYETHFIITCRTASLEFNFTKFTEVEIADFNDQQIQAFVHKWFHKKDPIKEKNFLQQLSLEKAVKELANSPLLLTLLCLVFAEMGNFPKNRSDLYREGVKILLEKWDIQRNIYRDQIYKNLTNDRKQDLLSQVALITFKGKDYFIRQREVEKHISTYIQNLPEAETDPEVLRLDSEAVLKSIEAQHGLLIERARGIYSFSHLTFQEYFTARKIVNTSQPKILEQSLKDLASYITEKRWREVFLLAIGLLSEADILIQSMKEKVDLIVAKDRVLQELLFWVNQRAEFCQSLYKSSAVRALYFTLAIELICVDFQISPNFLEGLTKALDNKLNLKLIHQSLLLGSKLSQAYRLSRTRRYNPEFAIAIANSHDEVLRFYLNFQWLNILKNPIPDPNDQQLFNPWWKSNGKLWSEQLNIFFAQVPETIPNFKLTIEQINLLKQYCISNEFLWECMNTNCYIKREIRQEIQDTLFLPIREIEKTKTLLIG